MLGQWQFPFRTPDITVEQRRRNQAMCGSLPNTSAAPSARSRRQTALRAPRAARSLRRRAGLPAPGRPAAPKHTRGALRPLRPRGAASSLAPRRGARFYPAAGGSRRRGLPPPDSERRVQARPAALRSRKGEPATDVKGDEEAVVENALSSDAGRCHSAALRCSCTALCRV